MRPLFRWSRRRAPSRRTRSSTTAPPVTPVEPAHRPASAPGWYPDPDRPDEMREWDGQRWTALRRAARPGRHAQD